MQPSEPPRALAVEVTAARPTDADSALIAQLDPGPVKTLPGVAYIVKIKLHSVPQPTGHGWALYVDDLRIPKYWEYSQGVYFKVFDPQFFADHEGENLRFSQNGTEFIDTGLKLPAPRARESKSARGIARLPRQEDVLK
jgi:hypothetical protein